MTAPWLDCRIPIPIAPKPSHPQVASRRPRRGVCPPVVGNVDGFLPEAQRNRHARRLQPRVRPAYSSDRKRS